MRICTVILKSTTPYSSSKMVDQEDFPKKEKESHEEYDERMWIEKATYDPEGNICIPAMALKFSVDEAAKRLRIKIPGKGQSTYSKLFVSGQICDGDVSLGIKKQAVEMIKIWANADGVRGSGKRVKRRFPYVKAWQATARFLLLDDEIPTSIFERALVESGRLIGIGRFRPEKGGLLGRFSVEKTIWSDA